MADTNSNGTIWFPNKRVIRTVLQSVAGAIAALAAGLAVFQIVAPQVLEAVREVLPPTWYVWLVGFIATVGTFAGVLSKVMTIPQVDAWLKHIGAGSTPAVTDLPDAVQTAVDQAVVKVATDPIEIQTSTILRAANRLGISPSEVLRDDLRPEDRPE
jgi:hypothetical protein